jgi:hypothetical protein
MSNFLRALIQRLAGFLLGCLVGAAATVVASLALPRSGSECVAPAEYEPAIDRLVPIDEREAARIVLQQVTRRFRVESGDWQYAPELNDCGSFGKAEIDAIVGDWSRDGLSRNALNGDVTSNIHVLSSAEDAQRIVSQLQHATPSRHEWERGPGPDGLEGRWSMDRSSGRRELLFRVENIIVCLTGNRADDVVDVAGIVASALRNP